MTRRKEIALVLAITGLGALLRLYQLGAQSLWLDELFSVFLSRYDLREIVARTAQDTMPPLYYFLLHLALQLGTDEAIVRLPSCLFSVLSIPLMYILARALFDARTAGLAALTVAISPFQVLFAQEARMYALMGFLVLAAVTFFHRAWTKGGFWNWVLFILATTLALYTHSVAFLYLIALDLFALVEREHWRDHWRQLVVAHFIFFVLFLPWAAVQVQQALHVQAGFWSSVPSPAVFVTVPFLFLNSDTMPPVFVGIMLFACIALFVLALVPTVRIIRSSHVHTIGLRLALTLFFVPLVGLYALSLFRPIFVERTLLASSFGLVLLLAWALAFARPRPLYLVLGTIVVVGMMMSLANYDFNPAVQKPPFREAAVSLSSQLRPGDVVVHTSDSSALAFNYYLPKLTNYFLAGDPDYVTETTRGTSGRLAGLEPAEWDSITSGHARAWLVVALDHNIDYQRARVRDFDAAFGPATTQNVGGIELHLYQVKR